MAASGPVDDVTDIHEPLHFVVLEQASDDNCQSPVSRQSPSEPMQAVLKWPVLLPR